MPNLHDAQRMVDLFTSVGARTFAVTNTDINENRIWPLSYHRSIGKRWARAEDSHFSAPALQHALAHMLELAAQRRRYTLADGRVVEAGENLIIRPISETSTFVQLDDLSAEHLERVRPAAFLIHATSPGNHQAWISVEGVTGDANQFIRRVRNAVGKFDKSASGATRIAGSENWKVKYLPEPPIVTIVESAPGRVMSPERLQEMHLLAEPEHAPAFIPRASMPSNDHPWPSYQIALARSPSKKHGGGPDRSVADINWCMIAITAEKTVEEVAAKLLEVSEKAREQVYMKKDKNYPIMTARKAARYVEDNRRGRSIG